MSWIRILHVAPKSTTALCQGTRRFLTWFIRIVLTKQPVMVLIACAGWVCNFYSAKAFPNRSDLTSAIGSFVVGTLGHIFGRFTRGSSFPVTVVGILFQLPSGLGNGGIFSFASENQTGSGNAYSDGFQVAEQLVSVAIGLTYVFFTFVVDDADE